MEEILLGRKGNIGKIRDPGQERRQSLKGVDDDCADIVDYIISCTHKIWEMHGIGLIFSHYGHNASVWTSEGSSYGREAMVESTLQNQSGYPERRLIGDDVLWTGDDEVGFHTSHRITGIGPNTGYTAYGPPTGCRVTTWGIANCFSQENRILEEWLVGDGLGLLLQFGFDIRETLSRLVRQDRLRGIKLREYVLPERIIGQTTPEVLPPEGTESFDIKDFVRRSVRDIWNWRRLDRIDDYYDRDYRFHTTRQRDLFGRAHFQAFVLTLLGAFPDAMMSIEHFYSMGNKQDGYRTMTRWSLQGTDQGAGPCGEPTGNSFYLIGISHHRVKGGRFVEEWTCFDEVALLKQLWRDS